MKIDFISFHLGVQYENREFDLEGIEEFDMYEKYKYIKNDMYEILGSSVEKILLYFNADILVRVDIKFQAANISKVFIDFSIKLETRYGKQHLSINEDKSILYKERKGSKRSFFFETSFRNQPYLYCNNKTGI